MFLRTGYFPIFRSYGSVLAVLAVGFLFVSGCRLTKERNTAAAIHPVILPAVSPNPAEQVRGTAPAETVTAYRPPMLSNFNGQSVITASPAVSPAIPKEKTPKTELKTELKPDPTVEKLNRRVAELEKQLAEAKNAETKNKEPVPATPLPKTLPALNIPGVTASSDSKSVRIAVPDTLLFVPDTYQFNPAAEETLRKIAGEIRANEPNASLEIEGHTDSKSTDPANVTQPHDIASTKTLAVMNYFVKSLRWDPAKIRTSSFGSSKPVADNGTAEGRSKNNRVEIVVTP